MMQAVKDISILAVESAAEYLSLTNGNFSSDIVVYSPFNLPKPFIVHNVSSLKDIEKNENAIIPICSLNQTMNDLLSFENVDQQIVYESFGIYYKNNVSFDGLIINEKNLENFDAIKEDVIS